jgi:hypothetical protein
MWNLVKLPGASMHLSRSKLRLHQSNLDKLRIHEALNFRCKVEGRQTKHASKPSKILRSQGGGSSQMTVSSEPGVSLSLSPSSSPHPTASPPSVVLDRPVTILEDPANFNIKHPLQYTWNLWLKDGSGSSRPGRSGSAPVITSGNWKEQLQDIDAISTVEDFWGYSF